MTKRHAHDLGLTHDLREMARLTQRRQFLRMVAGAGLLPLVGCGGGAASSGSADGGGAGACAAIPDETGGPYPADGTNGPNVLAQSGVVRSDLRPSFGAMTGTAAGVPLTTRLTVVDVKAGCAPLAGYAVYLWHCDRQGKYSLYNITTENYLRGVQETDGSGVVTFTSIFPAAYSGRWPHIHFEVFSSLAKATSTSGKVKTSQLALPVDACNAVFATTGYEQSVANMARTPLSSDNVFGDGYARQLASIEGSAAAGYVASLVVGVSV